MCFTCKAIRTELQCVSWKDCVLRILQEIQYNSVSHNPWRNTVQLCSQNPSRNTVQFCSHNPSRNTVQLCSQNPSRIIVLFCISQSFKKYSTILFSESFKNYSTILFSQSFKKYSVRTDFVLTILQEMWVQNCTIYFWQDPVRTDIALYFLERLSE